MSSPELAAPISVESLQLQLQGFNIAAAIHGAISDVASNEELALDTKVERMEQIVAEGSSELFREFVDFSLMAAQLEMYCNHDHGLMERMRQNPTLSDFMDTHGEASSHQHAGHTHEHGAHEKQNKKAKKKRTYSWLSYLLFRAG